MLRVLGTIFWVAVFFLGYSWVLAGIAALAVP